MKRAKYVDKQDVFDILEKTYDDTIGVNDVKKQDVKRKTKLLVEYSIERCLRSGKTYLSGDRTRNSQNPQLFFDILG